MSQGGMAAQQPMQMGMSGMTPMMMMAPMTTPLMMPMLDASCSAGFGPTCFGAAHVGFTDLPQWQPHSWPADVQASAWPVYYGESQAGEAAPQQFPMPAIAFQEPEAEPSTKRDAAVPAQVRMDSVKTQPETTMDTAAAAASIGTLRHRRVQEGSFQDSHARVSNSEEDIDAQARELANGLLVQMQAGGEAHWAAVASFERMAFANQVSSRAAQMMIAEASMTDKVALAGQLRGHVRSAVQSKHANHVVQKITEVLPVASASFIVDELKGFGRDVARHTFGCRVFCRILEHLSPNDVNTIEFIEEVFNGLEELCSHSYGSFVVRHLLEFGLPEHKERVVRALRTDLVGYTKHKFGSHVVEGALRHAGEHDQQVVARELLSDKDQLLTLAANQYGRHVVRALLAMPDGLKQEALDVLRPMEGQLKASRFGKSVFQAVRAAA